MAKHFRRASNKAILRKRYKQRARQANTRIRHLNHSKYGGSKNPAIRSYLGGKKKFSTTKGMSFNDLRRENAKANSFIHAKTATPKGAKKVLKNTLGNIFHGSTTEQDIQMLNNINVLINNPEYGINVVERYFDIYYKVKDVLAGMHIGYTSSDEIMNAITTEIESGNLIKDVRGELTVQGLLDDPKLVGQLYLNVMSSADLIEAVISDLT